MSFEWDRGYTSYPKPPCPHLFFSGPLSNQDSGSSPPKDFVPQVFVPPLFTNLRPTQNILLDSPKWLPNVRSTLPWSLPHIQNPICQHNKWITSSAVLSLTDSIVSGVSNSRVGVFRWGVKSTVGVQGPTVGWRLVSRYSTPKGFGGPNYKTILPSVLSHFVN